MSDAKTSEIVTVALIADYDSRTVVMRARWAGGIGIIVLLVQHATTKTTKNRQTTTNDTQPESTLR